MKGTHSITINGRLYDAVTGMPMQQSKPVVGATSNQHRQPTKAKGQSSLQRAFVDIAKPQKLTPFKKAVTAESNMQTAVHRQQPQATAHTVHQRPQKSQTLYRAALKRPEPTTPLPRTSSKRSPVITKFAPEKPAANSSSSITPKETIPTTEQPAVHPAVAKALQTMRQTPEKPPEPLSSKELKEQLIKERLAEVDAAEKKAEKSKRSFFKQKPRLTAILTSTLAILLLGGYLTYLNLPNISMRVAATRAGIAANFPNYKPDGYSFEGPITYAPGEVTMKFSSNTNSSQFTLKQKGSNWDSQAVLDNFVSKQTDNYLTYQEKGLTIYSFDNKAAWVNGGLLYSVEGDAQLSSEQLLRLATSM